MIVGAQGGAADAEGPHPARLDAWEDLADTGAVGTAIVPAVEAEREANRERRCASSAGSSFRPALAPTSSAAAKALPRPGKPKAGAEEPHPEKAGAWVGLDRQDG